MHERSKRRFVASPSHCYGGGSSRFRTRWCRLPGAATAALLVGLVAAGCASGPVAPEDVEQTEKALLQPFLVNKTVRCNELLIEMTGNFNQFVGQPAVDPRVHEMRHEQAQDGSYIDKIWTNRMGLSRGAMTIAVGELPEYTPTGIKLGPRTTFSVTHEVRLRIHQRTHAMTLKATASGERVVVQEARGRPRAVREFVIADGVLGGS
ncbi:MAG: hypothetical protein NXI31_21455 [bacterium]|nr:hypothetical protein [bacterium]